MAKLSGAMIKALREAADHPNGYVNTHTVNKRTLDALRSRFLIKPEAGSAVITLSGRAALLVYADQEQAKREQAERASRPVPASAFVEPSARTAPVMGLEYEDEPEGCPARLVMPNRAPYSCDRQSGHEGDHRGTNGTAVASWDDRSPYAVGPDGAEQAPEPSAHTAPVMGLEYDEDEPDEMEREAVVQSGPHAGSVVRVKSGPSVRLTPAPAGVEQEATDAEILQLLIMLDHGVKVSRPLYQDYTAERASGFTLNPDRLNRAARDAVRFGLVTQDFVDRLYRLSAEPIHLLRLEGDYWLAACGTHFGDRVRLRVTTDPAKVTHDRCK